MYFCGDTQHLLYLEKDKLLEKENMSKILTQIESAENTLRESKENPRKKMQDDVLESLSLLQDKVSCLDGRLRTLLDSLGEKLIFN